MKTWLLGIMVGLQTLGGEGVAYTQSSQPEALQVAAAIVQQRHELRHSPQALADGSAPTPTLLDLESVIAAVRNVSGRTVQPSDVKEAMRPVEYRAMTSKQAIQCEPWARDPRQCSYRTIDDGYGIRFESLKRTPEGWDAIVQYYFTGDERNEGQYEIQWYRVLHRIVKKDGRWVQTGETTLGQS